MKSESFAAFFLSSFIPFSLPVTECCKAFKPQVIKSCHIQAINFFKLYELYKLTSTASLNY